MCLPSDIAHAIRRPDDIATFGYDDSLAARVTDEHRAILAEVDEFTDKMVLEAYGAVDEAGAAAVMSGLEQMEAKLA